LQRGVDTILVYVKFKGRVRGSEPVYIEAEDTLACLLLFDTKRMNEA
jgi:hypothetical protein